MRRGFQDPRECWNRVGGVVGSEDKNHRSRGKGERRNPPSLSSSSSYPYADLLLSPLEARGDSPPRLVLHGSEQGWAGGEGGVKLVGGGMVCGNGWSGAPRV